MHDSPRLPPLLNAVSILAFLFPLAALAVSGFAFVAWFSSSQSPLASVRVGVINFNLFVLGLDCVSAVAIYHGPDRGLFPLNSWQSRMRVIAVVAAVSICTLVLAVVLPPSAIAFVYVFPICNLVALGVIVALLWPRAR